MLVCAPMHSLDHKQLLWGLLWLPGKVHVLIILPSKVTCVHLCPNPNMVAHPSHSTAQTIFSIPLSLPTLFFPERLPLCVFVLGIKSRALTRHILLSSWPPLHYGTACISVTLPANLNIHFLQSLWRLLGWGDPSALTLSAALPLY